MDFTVKTSSVHVRGRDPKYYLIIKTLKVSGEDSNGLRFTVDVPLENSIVVHPGEEFSITTVVHEGTLL